MFLKCQNEQLQEECDQLNEQLQSFKSEADSMRNKLSKRQQKVESAQAEVIAMREELTKHLEGTELTKASLRESLDEAHNTINDLHQREESLSHKIQCMLSNQKKQEDELENLEGLLDRAKLQAEEAESKLKHEIDRQIKRWKRKLPNRKRNLGDALLRPKRNYRRRK